jgi:hypothetical protein
LETILDGFAEEIHNFWYDNSRDKKIKDCVCIGELFEPEVRNTFQTILQEKFLDKSTPFKVWVPEEDRMNVCLVGAFFVANPVMAQAYNDGASLSSVHL